MTKRTFQDLLPFVRKPSRYLGSEVNRIIKDPSEVNLKVALAFPDLYDIGTSHFGIQILYHMLNEQDEILAERVFAPAKDLELQLRQNNILLPTIESGRPLNKFDIVGFSLLYELNFTNVLNMLDLGKISVRWIDRTEADPFIIAGGPTVCNPEPMADFFDAMVFGDGENVVLQMSNIWIRWNSQREKSKVALLEQWSQLEGVYIPRFFKSTYDKNGFQHLTAQSTGHDVISRVILGDMDKAFFPDQPIIPFGRPVHDRLRIEISRGCTRGCRFCQAGMIYRPVRERSAQTILDLIKKALDNTGYEDLSLLSLSTGDYTCLAPLMEIVMQICRRDRIAVSLPSLRAGVLTPELMTLIKSVRKTGFTIAPEAGSQRLRDVINKNITYADVEKTVKQAFELGWQVIKLYFMIGLPTETKEDMDAIVEMVKKLKQIKGPKQRKGKINVSITTFVPKAHTPFQWASQISLDESIHKIQYLRKKLKIPGVYVKWQKPEMSLLEGVLARGDRRAGALIEQAWRNGCTFDGWNDQFEFDLWQQALSECNVTADFFTTRFRELEEPLPWQHMDAKVDFDFLKKQYKAAFHLETVDDCRKGKCHGCGVCDFDRIKPIVFDNGPESLPLLNNDDIDDNESFVWLSLKYTKLGDARLFGHLELNHIFSRAIRRAHIKVEYSKGFHPMPKISFDDPLPLGIESEAEYMRVLISKRHQCADVLKRLNKHLPQGVQIIDCQLKSEAKKQRAHQVQRFSIQLENRTFNRCILQKFEKCRTWPYIRTNHKGREHHIDLKSALKNMNIDEGKNTLIYDIVPQCEHTLRPADILLGVFKIPAADIQKAKLIKIDPTI